jgi:hypothetical protein
LPHGLGPLVGGGHSRDRPPAMYMSLQNDDSKISSPVGVSHSGVNSIEEAFQTRHIEAHSPRDDFEGLLGQRGFKRFASPQTLFASAGLAT